MKCCLYCMSFATSTKASWSYLKIKENKEYLKDMNSHNQVKTFTVVRFLIEIYLQECMWFQIFYPSRVAVCARNQMKTIKITSLGVFIEFIWGKG